MDFTSNNNPTAVLRAIDHLVDSGKLPDFVADIKIPSVDEVAGLSKTAFADQKNLKYPIYNRDTVFLSIADFHGSGDGSIATYERIKSAAAAVSLVEINDELEKFFEEQWDRSDKSEHTKYAFVYENEGFYPLGNREEVEMSAASFVNSINRFPLTTAYEIAQEIVKSAQEFDNVEFLPTLVVEMGEKRTFCQNFLESQIELRKQAAVDTDAKDLYEEILKSASEQTDTEELVIALEEIDRQALPYEAKQNKMIKNAYEAFHGGHLEANLDAAAAQHVYFSEEDILVPTNAFEKVASAVIDARFSKTFAEKVHEIKKLASEDPFSATALVNGLDKWARKEFLRVLAASN
jgi:hypothetical protein